MSDPNTTPLNRVPFVTLDELPPGFAFVTQSGVLAFKTEYSYNGINNDQCICYLFGSGETAFFKDGNETLVRPVELAELE